MMQEPTCCRNSTIIRHSSNFSLSAHRHIFYGETVLALTLFCYGVILSENRVHVIGFAGCVQFLLPADSSENNKTEKEKSSEKALA